MHRYTLNCLLVTAMAVALGVSAALLSRRMAARGRWTATLAALTALLAFTVFLRDGPLVARLVPSDDLLAFGQWTPLLLALFLGFAWPLLQGGLARRSALAAVASLLVLCASFRSLVQPVPPTSDREAGGCVLQSRSMTCGAAAAAILLRQHGIAATESEMVALCRTREQGTPFHGIIRGLRIKTSGTSWIVECSGLAAPALVSVRLTPAVARRDRRYESDWGWTLGQEHVVVFLGFDDRGASIADPSAGFEHWSRETLQDLWHGAAITLSKRP